MYPTERNVCVCEMCQLYHKVERLDSEPRFRYTLDTLVTCQNINVTGMVGTYLLFLCSLAILEIRQKSDVNSFHVSNAKTRSGKPVSISNATYKKRATS